MELLISAGDGESTRVKLSKSPLTLGRASNNDLAYPEDTWLSRSHLVFEQVGEGWQIRDCSSRNGTRLNSSALREATVVKPGDRIQAGHIAIEVAESQPAPTPITSGNTARTLPDTTVFTSLHKILSAAEPGTAPAAGSTLGSLRTVKALLRAGQELAMRQPLQALFKRILELSLSAVDGKQGVILTLEENGTLTEQARRGTGFNISTSVRNRVIEGRASMMVNDTQLDQALREQKSIVFSRVRSMLAAPLQTNERVLGLIYVDNGAEVKSFSSEDLDLLTVMANIAAIRIEHARLAEIELFEKAMEQELAHASEIQKTFLPQEPPRFDGFDLAGLNLCCRTVGGDYYDFVPYQDGRLGVAVGDVSGKGMGAALLMSGLQARVRMLRETMPAPDQAVTILNRSVAESCPVGKFITFFFGLLRGDGYFEYCNAGHNYPLVRRANGTVERLDGASGLVMGLFANVRYTLESLRLDPGDLLAIYSDGVTEAANARGDEFGEQGLTEFLNEHAMLCCRELTQKLVAHVRHWQGRPSFSDDFTILLIKRKEFND